MDNSIKTNLSEVVSEMGCVGIGVAKAKHNGLIVSCTGNGNK